MSEAPLVSICIPANNAAEWLSDAIDSALGQTFSDFELLVVDNGSIDATAEIARSYDDERIRVESFAERIGAVANHNRAIRLSRGSLVKFLHADDLLLPTCLERMVELALEDPSIALVFAPREVLLEPGFEPHWAEQFGRPHEHFEALGRINEGRALFRQLLAGGFEENWIGEPSAVLLRREPLDRAGLLNERLFQIADLELWARLALEHRIGFVDEVLSVYRHHEGSGTVANARAGRDWLDKLWLFESLLELPGLSADEHARVLELRRAALRRALRSQAKRIFIARWSPDLARYAVTRIRGTGARVVNGAQGPIEGSRAPRAPREAPARSDRDRRWSVRRPPAK